MFNFSGSEIIFLLLAGLVVLGPERLPGVIRQVGKVYGEIRRTTQGFERELRSTFDEPLKDFRSTAESIRSGFGEVDTDTSPPMRPEQSEPLTPEQVEALALHEKLENDE